MFSAFDMMKQIKIESRKGLTDFMIFKMSKFKIINIYRVLLPIFIVLFSFSNQAFAANTFVESKSYSQAIKEYEQKGYKEAKDAEVVLTAKNITKCSQPQIPLDSQLGKEKGFDSVLRWQDKDMEWAEWKFDVPSSGLYEIYVNYLVLEGSGSAAQRALSIDGESPFKEADNISFYRLWKESGEPKVNNIGDEVWPKQIEQSIWQYSAVTDNQGFYSEPLKFYLEKGSHTMRFTYVDQPIAISDIVVKAPTYIPSYGEVKTTYSDLKVKATQPIRFEAEITQSRNNPTIRRETSNDPVTSPSSIGNRILNIMGAKRWRSGNQEITWAFDVPEEGLYKIDMRVMQNYADGLPSYRQIKIDGQIPFKELEAYSFAYSKDWRKETLKNSQNEPYLFYLTKGKHELTMTVKLGPICEVVQNTTQDILALSELTRKILKITSSNPDPNFEYELDRNIPGLVEDLKYLSDRTKLSAEKLTEISEKRPSIANSYMQISDQLLKLSKDPDLIPKSLTDLDNNQINLGSYITSLQSLPLAIDYFVITPEDQDANITEKSNFFQKFYVTCMNFLSSFTKNYDRVGSVYNEGSEDNVVLDVWISRGTEWAEIMKEMADEDFTQNTGISINLNVLPSGQLGAGSVNTLMLSITSGKAPDVALGVDKNSPVEFAFRDAVADLTQFSDFEQVKNRFYPNIFIPFEYQQGVYALPETMDFTVLYYRTDLLQDMGVKIPDTWDDVRETTLPKLYENNMNFYYSQLDFAPFLFQHGGQFYNAEGTKSGLETAEAYQAFKEWTDLFTNYGIPKEANFFTRMRNGDTPIGVATYSHYMQLSTSAPELYGRWAIAPVPGIISKDGAIDRSVGSIASTSAVIMQQSTKKQEAWEFIKWWTSDEVQARYGKELEALLGVEARWNTANKKAFEDLPWDRDDLEIIKYQLDHSKEQPIVLGGYFTTRHLTNAWNRVVINNETVRDSIEQAVEDINKELTAKQEEYGYIAK